MILNFKDKLTEAVWNGTVGKGFPADLVRVEQRKLAMLNAAVTLDALRVPPANRLEALTRDRAGQHSIRVIRFPADQLGLSFPLHPGRACARPGAGSCGRGCPSNARAGERLSCWSSGLPRLFVSEDGVEDDEEAPGDGDEGEHLGLSGGEEAVVEGFQDGVVPAGDQGGHEQHRPDGRAAAADEAAPLPGPDWRVKGASPARAAIFLRSSVPSSGSSAISVRAMIGPTPGTEDSRSSASRQAGEPRTAVSMSRSISASSFSRAWTRRSIDWRTRATAVWRRRCRSAPIISTICRRRATSSARRRVASSGIGRSSGCGGLGEVGDHRGVDRVGLGALAEGPGEGADLGGVDHHHRQAGRRPAPRRRPSRSRRWPPARPGRGRAPSGGRTSSARPSPSRGTANASPEGRIWTSRRSLETSMPTVICSCMTRPCLSELLRPWRLSGFEGTTGGAPISPTVSNDPGVCGLPPVTAPGTLPERGRFKLQGGDSTRSPLTRLGFRFAHPHPLRQGERGRAAPAGTVSRRSNGSRMNDQFRVCFVWRDGNAADVEITDYH